jgi:energy-coupling factor transporter ATP-binding protein EcfA2
MTVCGLQFMAGSSPLCLSHGERHIVALASALAARPELLFLDEPLTGLDDQLARSVLAILDYWASQHGTAVLLASHRALPVTWGDQHLVLQGGRLHEA